jgi:hypothetical protein
VAKRTRRRRRCGRGLGGLAGLPDGVTDARGGGFQQLGEHAHGAHLPLVEQRDQQARGIVEQRLDAQVAGCPSGSAAALLAVALLGPRGRGQGGGQAFQLVLVMPVSPGSASRASILGGAGGTARLTDLHRLVESEAGWVRGGVPGAVHGVPLDRQSVQLLGADRDTGRVVAGIPGLDARSAAGAGRRDRLDDDLVAGQRPARQLMVMWANRRCSIVFHLDVPGGKWQTVIASPVWAARPASSLFHTRYR